MGKFMSVRQAAQATGLSSYYILQGVRAGRFPAVPAGAGRFLIDPDIVEQVMRREADKAALALREQSEKGEI